jgi:hypothetical protein
MSHSGNEKIIVANFEKVNRDLLPDCRIEQSKHQKCLRMACKLDWSVSRRFKDGKEVGTA